jgi:hypothetical protein
MAADMPVLAIQGFLELFFAALLGFLVVVVTAFGLYVGLQLFRNPGRDSRSRR